jgi:hypothetical protein
MPFKLEHNKNYAYLFLVIVGLTVFSFLIGGGKFSGFVFFLSLYYLGALQLHSGVALSSSWTAKYKREENPFIFWIIIVMCFAMGTLYLTAAFKS